MHEPASSRNSPDAPRGATAGAAASPGARVASNAAARAPLLVAHEVEYDYPGPLRALSGADLSLAPGELVVIIGPNGSGKSTLVKVLSGLLTPARGSVRVDGRPLAEFTPHARARRVAVVPQFLPVLPDVIVADFVAGGRYAHRAQAARAWTETFVGRSPSPADRDAVRAALEACDAHELACRSLAELSGGQRQRVLVARAVAQDAAVLLVDEPTNALDPDHQLRVFDLLSTVVGESRAACVVTHDLNLAGQYATRLVLMDRGRVVAQGTPGEILRAEVLAPVYGSRLVFGAWPDGRAGSAPFVLPRRAAESE